MDIRKRISCDDKIDLQLFDFVLTLATLKRRRYAGFIIILSFQMMILSYFYRSLHSFEQFIISLGIGRLL